MSTASSLHSAYRELPYAFVREAAGVARRVGMDGLWLMAIMDFGTGGTFSAQVENPYSGFVGLIQFGPGAAADLGTSVGALSQMTEIEQLAYVEAYFAMRIRQYGPLRTLEDAYMAVLYPAAIGRSAGYVLFRAPETAYVQNAHLDANSDGAVTKAEAVAPVRARLRGSGLVAGITGWSIGEILMASTLAFSAGIALYTIQTKNSPQTQTKTPSGKDHEQAAQA